MISEPASELEIGERRGNLELEKEGQCLGGSGAEISTGLKD